MNQYIGYAVACCAFAVLMPSLLPEFSNSKAEGETAFQPRVTKSATGSGQAVAWRSSDGHFHFEASLNGAPVPVLVDTGASAVAISRETASRIGIELADTAFIHEARTANGTTRFARAMIDEIVIEGVQVFNVEAAVLPDGRLSDTLLGMSFLGQLQGFNVKGDRLTLTQ